MKLQECIHDLLIDGLDDWVDAAGVASIAKSTGGETSDRKIKLLSLSIVREVVQNDLMTLGDLTKDGFREWKLSMNESLHRVTKEWDELNRSPDLGEIFWLSNTEKGDKLARSVSEK